MDQDFFEVEAGAVAEEWWMNRGTDGVNIQAARMSVYRSLNERSDCVVIRRP